jgi:hypothetical protein
LDYRYRPYLIIFVILVIPVDVLGQQTEGYEFTFHPDIWYNDVDGIRLGSLIEGRLSGTTEEGPHRMDAGIWLGTWFPSLPISYSLNYTEPVAALSNYANEFNIQLHSSVIEGYQSHGGGIHKRWQQNQNNHNFWQIGIDYRLEKRFDHEYVIFPQLWSNRWKGLIKPNLVHQHMNRFGIFNLNLHSRLNTVDRFFYTASVTLSQQISLGQNWELRLRGYSETISNDAYNEYRILLGSGPEIGMLNSRISRSKGSIPVLWVNRGLIHFAGGANMRGYQKSEIHSIVENNPRFYKRAAAMNIELDFPNPVQHTISNMDIISEFLSFRSYFFTDFAAAYGHEDSDENGFYSNLGAGLALSFNIPDYLGKPRGFVVRYESPFWLSDPDNNEKFHWRHLLGFGATITF